MKNSPGLLTAEKPCKTKPLVLFLMQCIGGSVTKLRLDYNKESSMKYYQNLLNKITEKQQLTSISVPSWYDHMQTWTFIQSFSFALDHLEIDPNLMTNSLCDSLNLKCLTLLNTQEKCFSENCPKASTVIFKNSDGSSALQKVHVNFSSYFLFAKHKPSPYLNTVKELIFFDENVAIKKHFGFFALAGSNKDNVYVRPILEYGTQLFNVQQKKIAAYLERPQKLFTRMLYRRQHRFGIIPSYPARLKEYGMKSLHERRNIIDLQTGFEFAHVSTQNGCALRFKPSNYNTRFKKNYSSKEKITNKLRPSHFSTRTSTFMNQLKINISNFAQKKQFKQHLMNTEIDHYYS